jgi:ribosomal protein S18 acetylase RimI-like enzyme
MTTESAKSPEFGIRRARRRDADEIADLAMMLGRWIRDTDTRTTADDIRTYGFGRNRWCDILVAHEGDRLLGYALYRVFFEGFTGRRRMFLSDVAVAPKTRRGGVGHALMAAVAREALKLDCDVVTWECSETNDVALGFYDKLEATHRPGVVSLQIDREQIEGLAGT